MKVTIAELVNSYPHLDELVGKDAPGRVANRARSAMEQAHPHVKRFEDYRQEQIQNLGFVPEPTEDDPEPAKRVAEENWDEFANRINEFASEEVEIKVKPIPEDDIERVDEIKGSTISALDWLIGESDG